MDIWMKFFSKLSHFPTVQCSAPMVVTTVTVNRKLWPKLQFDL